MIKIRRQHSEAFKFKVALAALRGDKTQAELIHQFSICESLIQKWKTHLMQNGAAYFHGKPLPVLKNKLMSYSFSLTKKAAAFFRISRSSLRRWTSFCESLYFFLSLCCFYMLSVIAISKICYPPAKVWLLIPRHSAVAACAYRWYVTSLTASF